MWRPVYLAVHDWLKVRQGGLISRVHNAFKACLSSYRDEVAFKHFAEHGYLPLEDEDAPVKEVSSAKVMEVDSAKPGGSAYLSASDVGGWATHR